MVDREPPHQRVTLLGGPRSGKTALVRRLVGEGFEPGYTPTTLPKWHNKRVQTSGGYLNIALQDTPGQDCFQSAASPQSSLMVVYDSTSPRSFSLAEQLLQRLQQLTQRKVLVAAKCDEPGKQVQGQRIARELGVDFVETSARTGTNVEEALMAVVRTGDESPTAIVSAELGGLSVEDIREFISFNADVDHLPSASDGNYSPPLPLSPESPDSFEEGEEGPEAMVLLEEVGEGESVLTLVPMHVSTNEASTQTEPRRVLASPTKKTEELDKFWLRQFRKYVKRNYASLKSTVSTAEKACWKNYLDPKMKPEKNRQFKSYSRAYKQELFKDPAFAPSFRRWFEREGEKLLEKRFGKDSPGFLSYYEHARTHFVEMDRESSDFDPEYVLKEA